MATEETTVQEPSRLKRIASGTFTAAKWLYGIPGIKSVLVTRIIQVVIKSSAVGAIAVAILDKLLGA